MQEWLTVIVVLLIVGILLDGWRRMRAASRDNIRVSRRARRFESQPEPADDHYTSELPNGGARVVAKRTPPPTQTPKPAQRREAVAQAKRESQIPQQVSLNLDESVPMLMESVDEQEQRREPQFFAPEDRESDFDEPDFQDGRAQEDDAHYAQDESSHPTPAYGHDAQGEYTDHPLSDDRAEPSFSALGEDEALDDQPLYTETPNETDDQPLTEEPDEVIIINVMAREGQQFAGAALLDTLLQCGMRYGDMNIFHRHARDNGEGPVIFSLANMVKPGVFDLDTMANFYTPGVSMFMTLPMRVDSIKAFDIMRETAVAIANTLGGELKDENRSVMTRQTMEHCRQRIADYERKRLSRAGA